MQLSCEIISINYGGELSYNLDNYLNCNIMHYFRHVTYGIFANLEVQVREQTIEEQKAEKEIYIFAQLNKKINGNLSILKFSLNTPYFTLFLLPSIVAAPFSRLLSVWFANLTALYLPKPD